MPLKHVFSNILPPGYRLFIVRSVPAASAHKKYSAGKFKACLSGTAFFTGVFICWCWGQKVFWPHDATDFSALRAPEILKTFEIAHFSEKNGSFSCFYGSQSRAFSCKHDKHDLLTLASLILYYQDWRRNGWYAARGGIGHASSWDISCICI